MTTPETAPLYERLGGRGAVQTAVDLFYDKVLDDYRISRFFETVDMERQRAKMLAFMTYAFGGAPNYSGASMRKAHEKMVTNDGLNEEHFEAVVEILAETLIEIGVSQDLLDEVLTIVNSTRNDVLNRQDSFI